MAQADLVSLENAKSWLSITTADTARDAALSRLITQISRAIHNTLNRQSLLPRLVTETYDGNGQTRILLRNWPAVSVTSLSIDGVLVPASTSVFMMGYVLEPPDVEPPGSMQYLTLRGKKFSKGESNIQVSYTAGYLVSGEAAVIPVSPHITTQNPYGAWACDYQVQFTDGTALTAVESTPQVSQYSVSNGVYTFADENAGRDVLLFYGFVPADLAQIALEWIAYRWASKDRIGQTSKSIGGQETVAYTNEAIPVFVAQGLQNFKRVIPC